jgi:hypothetical protein
MVSPSPPGSLKSDSMLRVSSSSSLTDDGAMRSTHVHPDSSLVRFDGETSPAAAAGAAAPPCCSMGRMASLITHCAGVRPLAAGLGKRGTGSGGGSLSTCRADAEEAVSSHSGFARSKADPTQQQDWMLTCLSP